MQDNAGSTIPPEVKHRHHNLVDMVKSEKARRDCAILKL